MRQINVGILGIGGFARTHHEAMELCSSLGIGRTTAIVVHAADDFPEEYRRAVDSGATLYENYETMFEAERGKLDLVTIPTGIRDHREHAVAALKAGFNVLCEKPVAATVEDAMAMKSAAEKSGRVLAIGFQHIPTATVQHIKKVRLSGDLGALREVRSYGCWPRTTGYYRRNNWAGKAYVDGKPVFDSPLQNAMAHFFQNMLYVAGATRHGSATPVSVYGESYRAKEIESADTQYITVETAEGVRISMAATHASERQIHPVTEYRFDHGRIRWHKLGRAEIYRRSPRGETLLDRIDDGAVDLHQELFVDTINAVAEGRSPLSTVQNGWQHTACVQALFENAPIVSVPKEFTDKAYPSQSYFSGSSPGANTFIADIEQLMERMFSEGIGFAEAGAPWAAPGIRRELHR